MEHHGFAVGVEHWLALLIGKCRLNTQRLAHLLHRGQIDSMGKERRLRRIWWIFLWNPIDDIQPVCVGIDHRSAQDSPQYIYPFAVDRRRTMLARFLRFWRIERGADSRRLPHPGAVDDESPYMIAH